MKTFTNCAAQGDLLIRRIDKLPEGVNSIPAENGKHILAHSETGHHHVVLDRPEISHYSFGDLLKSFLVVDGDAPALLEHERTHDTHETIAIHPGIYELRRQREYIPAGWRKAQD